MFRTMDEDDHYEVLGLPSGEEGSKLTQNQIKTAYYKKALELHPDKMPNDLQDDTNFKRLGKSYEVLKNESSRKEFDKKLRDQRLKDLRRSKRDPKRQKMVSDLEARERAAKCDWDAKIRQENNERIKRMFDEECARYRAMRSERETGGVRKKVNGGVGVAPTAEKYDQPDQIKTSNLVGLGFRKFEDDVLKKVAEAGLKQKLDRQGS